MVGVGPYGRKYLLERPSQDEVEMVLWRMVFGARQREDDVRRECKEREEEWLKREKNIKEWEDNLEIRESKLGNKDSGLRSMMPDLRIRENELISKDEEIKELKNEIEERVRRVREDHAKEMKVVLVCD